MSNRRRNSNNNGSFNKNKAKRIAKKVIALILAFAAGCAAVGGYVALTREKPLNENNLIKTPYFENVTKLEETAKGLKIKWDDDGTFAISGKHVDDNLANNAHYEVAFVQVFLEEGTYMFSSGCKSADDDTYGLFIEYNGKKQYAYTEASMIVIDTPTTVTIGFFVKNNYRVVYADFEPVLVKGDKAQGFFAPEE